MKTKRTGTRIGENGGMNLKYYVFIALFLSAGIFTRVRFPDRPISDTAGTTCKPWSSVGGCGASSGSAAGGAGLKWIGNEMTGTLLSMEVLALRSSLPDTSFDTTETFGGMMTVTTGTLLSRLSFTPRFADFSLTTPLMLKEGYGYRTGVLGDMALEVAKTLGMGGNLRLALGLRIPTGRYDIANSPMRYLLPSLQMGQGVFGTDVRIGYTFGFDWGIITTEASYSAGWMAPMTTEFGYDTTREMVTRDVRALQFTRNRWGAENEIGTVHPDDLGFRVDVGIRSRSVMHGFSVAPNLPLRRGTYQTFSTDHKSSFSTDSTAEHYYPDKASAQEYAERRMKPPADSELEYENPLVVGTDSEGHWMVLDREEHTQLAPFGMTFQYSLEKSDTFVPILIGGSLRIEYFKEKFRLSGIAAGLGFRFGVI